MHLNCAVVLRRWYCELTCSVSNNVYKNLVAGQDTLAAEEGEAAAPGVAATESEPVPSLVEATAAAATTTAAVPVEAEKKKKKKGEEAEEEAEEEEPQYEQVWTNGDIVKASGGPCMLIVGLLAAIAAGVAMPVRTTPFLSHFDI